QAMFDRVDHPALGRRGGSAGAPTTIAQDDGSAMNGKGKQFVAHGRRVVMAFPGGAGYGDPSERSVELVKHDLARGYISAETAAKDYELSVADIADVQAAVARGDKI
ncbi:MAG: hydantoinase B/oxoprolinase family protein, partial [Planktotalea sp.]